MSEENQEPPEETEEPAEKKIEDEEVILDPPLEHRKVQVIALASLLAGLFIYDAGIKTLEWTPFLSVGLAINAGVVFAVLLYFYPIVVVAVSLLLLLLASWVNDIGYWLTGISGIVYFLTAFRAKKKAGYIED